MIIKCLLLILIGAMIGWITNFIAIKMLFKPYKEVNLIFFKIQGVLPKRKKEIGKTIAEIVDNELISTKDIISKISSEDMEESIGLVVDNIFKSGLKEEIIKKFPMAAFFLSDSILEKIREIIKKSILENKQEVIKIFLDYLEQKIDIKEIIIEKVNNFSLPKIEKIIISLAKKELKHIEYVGAILGGVIGMIQFIIVTFI